MNAIEFVDGIDVKGRDRDKLICKLVELECIENKNQELREKLEDLKKGVRKMPQATANTFDDVEFRIDYQYVDSDEIYSDYNLFDFIYYVYMDEDEVISRYVDKYAWCEMNTAEGLRKELKENSEVVSQLRLSMVVATFNEILTRCLLNYKRGNKETSFSLDIYSTNPKIQERIYIRILNEIEL
jgi:hypothetical protein